MLNQTIAACASSCAIPQSSVDFPEACRKPAQTLYWKLQLPEHPRLSRAKTPKLCRAKIGQGGKECCSKISYTIPPHLMFATWNKVVGGGCPCLLLTPATKATMPARRQGPTSQLNHCCLPVSMPLTSTWFTSLAATL